MDDQSLLELLKFSARSKYSVKVISHKQLKSLKFTSKPTYLVVHYGSSQKGHYVAYFIKGRSKGKPVALMLDSFGYSHNFYNHSPPPFFIKGRIKTQLQKSTSSLCGLYTWFFLYRLVQDYSIKSTLSLFGANKEANDGLIKESYKKFIKKFSLHFKNNLSPRFYCVCKNTFVRQNR